VDTEELDLFHSGVTLQHNVPSDMCYYLSRIPYYYEKFQMGSGPGFVRLDTDQNGNVGEDTNSDGVVDQPVATCQYDYASQNGPNCCLGTFTRVTRAWNATNLNYDVVDVTPNIGWGGVPGECLGGAATKNWPKTPDGWPYRVYTHIDGEGVNDVWSVEAPIKFHAASNVFVANWFDPVDHLGGPPLPAIEPYYNFACLDRAHEVIAEINVMVREWNTMRDFEARVDFPTKHSEVGFEDPPFNLLPKNDFWDWKEFGNTFPESAE
jgi:hypothetical protein